MIKDNFFKEYYEKYNKLIINESLEKNLLSFEELALKTKENDSKIIFAGNGASASISSHGAVDFSKQGKIRAITFNEANLITCLSNDYGYEIWVSEAIKLYANTRDLIVLISVSGESENLIKAAELSKEIGLTTITFTGRSKNNSLSKLGDISFWVDSHAYNIVECIHMIWITSVIDKLIGCLLYTSPSPRDS